MIADPPRPLTPRDCDLRDFPYMQLDVVRLRDSTIAAGDATAFRAAVLLWCASWHQVPAASLPNDDAMLARLAGYGRDVRNWKRARAKGALHGFVLCADGRLYHPVVAAKAVAAYDAKAAQRRRTEAARAARHSTSTSTGEASDPASTPTAPGRDSASTSCGGAVEPPGAGDYAIENLRPAISVTYDTSRSKGEGEGEGEESNKERTSAPTEPHPAAVGLALFDGANPPKVDEAMVAFDAWNALATEAGLSTAQKLDDKRRTAIRTRLRDDGGLEAWTTALKAVHRNPWLQGENERGWRANLDFVCRPSSFRKLIEGGYDRSAAKSSGKRSARAWMADYLLPGAEDPPRGDFIDADQFQEIST